MRRSKECKKYFLQGKQYSQCPGIVENKESNNNHKKSVVHNEVVDKHYEVNNVTISNCESVKVWKCGQCQSVNVDYAALKYEGVWPTEITQPYFNGE